MEYRKEDEKETMTGQPGMDVNPVGNENENNLIQEPSVQLAAEEPPMISIGKRPPLVSQFMGLSKITRIIIIAAVLLVLVLGSVGANRSHVKKTWVSFLRTEMMLYGASATDLDELADYFEQDRKDQGLSRKEYMSIMRSGMRSGYYDE